MRPVGIGGEICYAVAKLVMRVAGDQTGMACGSLQLCAGLEVGIERTTHTVVQSHQERTVTAPWERSDEELEEGSAVLEAKNDRGEIAAAV